MRPGADLTELLRSKGVSKVTVENKMHVNNEYIKHNKHLCTTH